MNKKVLIIAIAIIVIVGLYAVLTYNGLITMRETAVAQLQQVETQYQRRFDLIPNLVEAVKGNMKQEQTVFKNIADARANYAGAKTTTEKALAAGQVESSLSRLLVVMENYPTLKSSEAVQNLMTQLEGTENRVSTERQRYNTLVKDYEVAIKRFPRSIVASVFGFSDLTYFEAQVDAKNAPKVSF